MVILCLFGNSQAHKCIAEAPVICLDKLIIISDLSHYDTYFLLCPKSQFLTILGTGLSTLRSARLVTHYEIGKALYCAPDTQLCRKDLQGIYQTANQERCCLTQAIGKTTGLFVVTACQSSPPTHPSSSILEAKDPQRQV